MSQAIRGFLENGLATSREIQAHTGLSQAAVSRNLRSMGEAVVSLRTGRTIRYGVTRNAFGADDRLPFAMVDAYGNTVLVAYLRPLAHGGFLVEATTGIPGVFLGAEGNGFYDDLPYFLYDMRPQGFLGRQLARGMAAQTPDFPDDPRMWTTEHIGRYLVSNSDDLPGNLKFGQQAMDRVRRRPQGLAVDDYPEMADAVMHGMIPGSSAGGEQPKFTAFSKERQSHVIVKFSPRGDSEVARRWRDVLLSEYHAVETLHAGKVPAAETRLREMDGRLFLESLRFDRTGEYGRLPMLSLEAIDAEFTGLVSGWVPVVRALERKKLVSWSHYADVEMLWLFGRLINNTDMHLGNLSFGIEGDVFRLLPAYDMCSMGFAPRAGGEVLPFSFDPTAPDGLLLGDERAGVVTKLAHTFWEALAADHRISPELREFLARGNPVDQIIEAP